MTSQYTTTEIKDAIVPGTCHSIKNVDVASKGMKRISDKDTIAAQIAQLGEYTAIHYLSTGWPKSFLILVELNPEYPGKGKKYTVSFDDLVEGNPAGNKLYVAQSNKPEQIARWLLGRKVTLYNRQS